MAYKKWSPVEIDDMLSLLVEGKTKREIAEILGRDWWSVKKKLMELSKIDNRFMEISLRRENQSRESGQNLVQDNLPKRMEQELKIVGDRFVTGDWHINLHCMELFDRLIDAQKEKKKKGQKCGLCIVGDLINNDAYSHFPKTSKTSNTEDELDSVEDVLETLLCHFDEIEICLGNHDYRIMRALMDKDSRGAVSFERIAKMFLPNNNRNRIRIGNYFWMTLNERWRLTHPKNYSINATLVGKVLATKFHTNIVTAHQHHLGYAKDISGKFTSLDIGTMVDPLKCEYVYHIDSKSPSFNQGFVCIQDSIRKIEIYDHSSQYKIEIK